MTPFEQAQQQIATKMMAVEVAVGSHFPEALDPLKAGLATAALNCLSDVSLPMSVLLIGPSGVGKTITIDFMQSPNANDALSDFIYRTDRFTAASFVTHRADVSAAQANEIDLLPRIAGKTVLVKECGPLFTGRLDELRERFAVLTAVLDGKGYVSDTGARGRRGYIGDYVFQLIGATTPLSTEALALMAQLGPRIVFYGVDRPPKTVDELLLLTERDNKTAHEECRFAVRNLLLTLYWLHQPQTVDSNLIAFHRTLLRELVLWAKVVGTLRAAVQNDIKTAEEHPERVLSMLKNFSLGSALVHGRPAVNSYDLAQVRHIATSSGVRGRERTFLALLVNGGTATTPEIETLTGASTPTTLRYMRELEVVGLAKFNNGSPAKVELLDPYIELCGTR